MIQVGIIMALNMNMMGTELSIICVSFYNRYQIVLFVMGMGIISETKINL